MFAARANQENAIYEQQTAAAAKPLNQGVKGLAPKTPANKAPKTPFKVPLHDENARFDAGKTGGKGKQDGMFGEGKSGEVDSNAFVTPAGPRTRAPLGNKTTNAKATAFQTPAPPTQEKPSAKPSSPRMRRAKIKVHEAEPETTTGAEQYEQDIEYMPPREVPLPDHPDDWPHGRAYPQFEGKNLTRGWWSEFQPKRDEDDGDEFSDLEEQLKQLQKQERKEPRALQVKKSPAPKPSGLQKARRDPLTTRPTQTLNSKSAASALSQQARTAPKARTNPGTSSNIVSKKPYGGVNATMVNSRHVVAKVASNTTLGYSKGRAVSASARTPLSEVHGRQVPASDDKRTSPARPTSPGRTSLDDLFIMTGGLDISYEGDVGVGSGMADIGEEDEALRDFQLEKVEI